MRCGRRLRGRICDYFNHRFHRFSQMLLQDESLVLKGRGSEVEEECFFVAGGFEVVDDLGLFDLR